MAGRKAKQKNSSIWLEWELLTKLRSFVMPVLAIRDFLILDTKCRIADLINESHKSRNKLTPGKRSREHALEVDNIVYQFVGYPDDVQEKELKNNIGGCRWLWNRMKADRDAFYKETGEDLHNTPADYKDIDECAWLNDLDSYALCNVQLNHERAYNEFLKGEKGHPKFKKKGAARDSYTTNKDKRSDNIKLDGGCLKLPKITGAIKVKCHRFIRKDLTLKACTISHEPDGTWLFSILFEYPKKERRVRERINRFIETGDESCISHIGLDMSLPYLYVDSDGSLPAYMNDGVLISFSKYYKRLERRIAKEQRKLSHMAKDSANYKKQCVKIARLHAKAKHQRRDFLNQIAIRLARTYDVISIESLDMSAMKQALKFGKSISDNGWGAFVTILERKCEEYGSLLIKADKWFPSSKTCSHCGHIHKELKLSDRTYICPVCGHVMDRDHQAAINIDAEGLKILLEAKGKALKLQAA